MGATLAEFRLQLETFGREDVAARAEATLQQAGMIAAEAVVIGNAYGPGAPLDTGFLRSSFRVSTNIPADGPSTRPKTPGRKAGDPPLYPSTVDTTAAASATLGEAIYVQTMAEYAVYLEEGSMVRRHGPPENRGQPTPFIAPVEARWDAIAEDAKRRAGYGS